MTSSPLRIQQTAFARLQMCRLNEMRRNKKHCDLQFICSDEKEVWCHWNVLSTLCEGLDSCNGVIHVHQKSDLVDEVIDYFYTGCLDIVLQNVSPVLDLLQKLQATSIIPTVTEHFLNIFKTLPDDSIDELTADQLELALVTFKSDYELCAKVVFKWWQASPDERQDKYLEFQKILHKSLKLNRHRNKPIGVSKVRTSVHRLSDTPTLMSTSPKKPSAPKLSESFHFVSYARQDSRKAKLFTSKYYTDIDTKKLFSYTGSAIREYAYFENYSTGKVNIILDEEEGIRLSIESDGTAKLFRLDQLIYTHHTKVFGVYQEVNPPILWMSDKSIVTINMETYTFCPTAALNIREMFSGSRWKTQPEPYKLMDISFVNDVAFLRPISSIKYVYMSLSRKTTTWQAIDSLNITYAYSTSPDRLTLVRYQWGAGLSLCEAVVEDNALSELSDTHRNILQSLQSLWTVFVHPFCNGAQVVLLSGTCLGSRSFASADLNDDDYTPYSIDLNELSTPEITCG